MRNLLKEFTLSFCVVYLLVLIILTIENEKDLQIYLNTFFVCLIASIAGFVLSVLLKIHK